MYKVKTNWYFSKNKTLDRFYHNSERFRWSLVLDNEYDDIKSFLPIEELERMDLFINKLFSEIKICTNQILEWSRLIQQQNLSRKELAQKVFEKPKEVKSIFWFALELQQDNNSFQSLYDKIVEFIKNNLSNKRNFDSMRSALLSNLSLNDFPLPKNYKKKKNDDN